MKSEVRQRTAVVSVRFNKAELQAVQDLAHARGMTISTYLRTVALPHGHDWVLASTWQREGIGLVNRNYRCSDPNCRTTYFESVPA